ncbi:MAG: aldehyde dehydrogenase family protein [Acidobacteria bacterium]|nr:MAG: aldehyde dehydrogenase family protein [Acidobacteriota bacterium]
MPLKAKANESQGDSIQFTSWGAAEELFRKQKAYFDTDATKAYEWRVDQLDRLVRMLKENYQRFADASREDFKTASQENVFEVSAPIATSEFAKSQLKEWMKPVEAPLPKFLAKSGHKGMVYREPYGVTLIICPFNGPLLLSLRPAVAALSAGNPCMLKLSEALLATDELLLELIPKYFKAEAFSAVIGARETVTNLLKLPFDFLFLTGSVGVGKVVMRAAAENLTPVLLELGGQNPAIVDETANVPDAAKKIVWGAMTWGGQWCTSPGYAVVHESVAEDFVGECKKAVVELYGPDPKSNSDYSRVISAAAVKRLASLIDPKKVVYGGKSDAPARYLDPTILYPISWSDKIMEDEIFGPLLPILTYSQLGKLIDKIKSLPKPLAGYVFSRNQQTIDRVLQSVSFGGGAVNQTNVFLFIESMPYGGVGSSGIGNYYGKYGYDSLTHAKSILLSPPDVSIDHLFPPYTKEKVQALNQWFEY